MKFFFLICGTLALASGLVAVFLYFFGRRLSQTHREISSSVLPATPQQLWDVLADYRAVPQYGQQLATVVVEESSPRRLVRRVSGEGLPFGGTWTFELEPICQGTRLTITEEGYIRPPVFRAIAHLFIGLRQAPDALLASIEKTVGSRAFQT